MHNASIAEWILCRLTSKERAASMVGDLVEIGERKGSLWFWFSLAGVALSLFWRRPVAFVAALFAGTWLPYGFMAIRAATVHDWHLELAWMPVFVILIPVGRALCAVLLYAAIRYGVQDRATQMAFAWTVLVSAMCCFWWLPAVPGMCIAAALFLAFASILKSNLRKDALVILVSVTVGSAGWSMESISVRLYARFLARHLNIPLRYLELREHPSLTWVAFGLTVISLLAMTSVWSLMRGWMTRSQQLESEVEGSEVEG
jgi:hypothetical protein